MSPISYYEHPDKPEFFIEKAGEVVILSGAWQDGSNVVSREYLKNVTWVSMYN